MTVILIVEDEAFLREMTEAMIQALGYDTLSAGDVDEALSHLHSRQQIDALFTDIYLKKAVLGGCELAPQAIKLRPNLRVLYTTGNFVTAEVKNLFIEGTRCLQKPYTEEQLRSSLDDLLAT